MLTYAPLPEWSCLWRALSPYRGDPAALSAPWCREGEVAGWLSRSAWSLALVGIWRSRLHRGSVPRVWLPDFICDDALAPLRQTGAQLTFYPLDADLTPDYAACRALAEAGASDVFVLVHYFGQPAPAAPARDFCARHGAWLVEDCAHVLRPVAGIGDYGDFVLYSPHKLLPIPDGAVLVVRPQGPGKLEGDKLADLGPPATWAGQLEDHARAQGVRIRSGRRAALIWLGKRVLQKLGVGRVRAMPARFAERSAPAVRTTLHGPRPSGISRRLLRAALPSLAEVARWRQRHQLLWDELLINAGKRPAAYTGLGKAARPERREWTPYLLAYSGTPAAVEHAFETLRRQRIPVSSWPDLPPEVSARPEGHPVASRLRHGRLYLPVHQSLRGATILSTLRGRARRRVADRCGPEGIGFAWNHATREQWQAWLRKAGRSNLLQSWAYGEAKASTEGWRVRRGVFSTAGEAIALVQVLEKRVAGLLCVSRINRGPLFLRATEREEDKRVLDRLVRELGGLARGRLLSMAPELPLSGVHLALIAESRLRQSRPIAWESAWVDLSEGPERLRKCLDGKWRNMLSFAERQGLEVAIGTDSAAFEWMVERHGELVREQGFAGVPEPLLRALRRELGVDRQPMLVLRAMAGGDPVAGVCLAPHGSAATYLLGWNGERGRKCKATQFLLWRAMLHLQQEGYRWFDLGGLDEERTPGISAFKSGINGERYALVGEGWAW